MENQIKVKVAGHPESTLTFYPKASTGSIRDGVAFENGNTGGWVIAYSDFLKMVELAKQHHAQQSVPPTKTSSLANDVIMKHGKYKLRKVVKEYLGVGIICKDIQVRYELLECGHSVRYRDPASTAEKIARVGGARRKCYQCGTTTGAVDLRDSTPSANH